MRCLWALAALLAIYIGYCCIDQFQPEMVSGQRVLVTGASMGIGEQIAYHYARLGAHVVITARSRDRLQNVVRKCFELGPAGGKYHFIVADMADMAATEAVVKEAATFLGGLDVIILNHVYGANIRKWTGSAGNFTVLEKTMTVNLRAYVHLASHALPYLQQTNGSIGVVSSIAGRAAMPYTASYGASKFALWGFFTSLRQELLLDGVDVSITICTIGLVGTENAITAIKEGGITELLDRVSPPEPADAALAIIKGTSLRERHIYFPFQARLITAPRDWFPELIETLMMRPYASKRQ